MHSGGYFGHVERDERGYLFFEVIGFVVGSGGAEYVEYA